MNTQLHLNAFAKVNLGLDVVRRREDGYHDVRMIMQSVRLYDRIRLKKNASGEVRLSCNVSFLPLDDRNLVYKAVQMIREAYHIEEGVDVDIEKHIPVAAGLAGGSSDAAAAFVGMNQLFGLRIREDDLMGYGVKLGADIPFCIRRGTVLSEGIGEILTPLPPMPESYFVLVKPSFSMSTGFVYQHLTLDERTVHPDIDGMIEALKEGNLGAITERMGNVLEQVTTEYYPQVPQIKEDLRKAGALNSLMSGSGSTVFGVFDDYDLAKAAADSFRDRKDIRCASAVKPYNRP